MAYAGLPPASFTNNLTNVQLIDDISSSFNGSTQTFALTTNSSPFHAVSARSLLVTLGGVTQKPQVDYTVDGANITFTTAPVSGLTFAARNIYGLNYLNNVNDGVITPAKLSTGAPTWNTGGTLTVSGDLNVTGSFNSGAQGLFWGDDETANFGDGNDLKIYHNASDSYIVNEFGNLYIDNYANDNDIKLRTDNGTGQATDYIICDGSAGSVSLHHYGTKKFETTSTGVNITGTLKVNDIASLDSTTLSLGLEGGANGFINTQESLYVNIDSNNDETGKRFEIRHGATDDSGTQLLTVLDSGNVGIGITNPGANLNIASPLPTIRFTDTDVANQLGYSELNVSSNAGMQFYADPGNNRSDSDFRFFIDGSQPSNEVVRITPTGNVGIGTTDSDYKLRVEGTNNLNGVSVYSTTLSSGAAPWTYTLSVTGLSTGVHKIYVGLNVAASASTFALEYLVAGNMNATNNQKAIATISNLTTGGASVGSPVKISGGMSVSISLSTGANSSVYVMVVGSASNVVSATLT